MNSSMIHAPLLAALLPSALLAQLTITVSPDPDQVRPHSTLSFTARVAKPTSSTISHYLRCAQPESGCGYSSQKPLTIVADGDMQILKFKSFTIPSSAKPGASFCFEVYLPGKSATSPYGGTITIWPAMVVASACRQVSTPYIAAGSASKAGAAATVSQASARGIPSVPTSVTATTTGAATTSIARNDIGALPDLVITFEKAPVAKWIVRNVGTAKSAATQIAFRRLGVEGTKLKSVGGLAPGAGVEITVTPELDIYLVNATAEVDPSSQIAERDETNNRWESKDSR